MRKRWPILLLLTVATGYLTFREIFFGGNFFGGIAIGILLVTLILEWAEFLRARKS